MNDEELFEKIMNKELTICKTCDTIFNYVPQKVFCDECKREKIRKHYEENRDKILAKNRKYREENREKINEKNRKYYEENREKKLAIARKYREENREKINAKNRKYYEENREKILAKRKGEE